MPYFDGTDKFGLLENIQVNGRVILNLETVGIRPSDPEIMTFSPSTEKVTKALKVAKAGHNIIKGSAQIRAGLFLAVPDPAFGPVDEVLGIGLTGRGVWNVTKGFKSLAELAMN